MSAGQTTTWPSEQTAKQRENLWDVVDQLHHLHGDLAHWNRDSIHGTRLHPHAPGSGPCGNPGPSCGSTKIDRLTTFSSVPRASFGRMSRAGIAHEIAGTLDRSRVPRPEVKLTMSSRSARPGWHHRLSSTPRGRAASREN